MEKFASGFILKDAFVAAMFIASDLQIFQNKDISDLFFDTAVFGVNSLENLLYSIRGNHMTNMQFTQKDSLVRKITLVSISLTIPLLLPFSFPCSEVSDLRGDSFSAHRKCHPVCRRRYKCRIQYTT